jgi:O-acetyl-ADP-ribose deacetylase (regulator of RNase III)
LAPKACFRGGNKTEATGIRNNLTGAGQANYPFGLGVGMGDAISNRLKLVVGDITRLPVDVVVNAANEALCGGGGVDGAIHRAAGPGLLEECLKIGYCPQGEARLTKAYLLPARFIVHTVGPVWDGCEYGERETLASCYRSTLRLAKECGAQTIAFPCIATGTYGYPKAEACEVAVSVTLEWISAHDLPREVIFCCFEEEDAVLYRARLGRE